MLWDKADPPLPSVGKLKSRRYVWDQVRPWWIAHEIRKELGVRINQTRPVADGIPNVQISEARQAHLDAETKEFKLAVMRREYVHLSDYEQAHAQRILRERQSFASIKAKLTPRVGAAVAAIVDEEIHRALATMGTPQLAEGA